MPIQAYCNEAESITEIKTTTDLLSTKIIDTHSAPHQFMDSGTIIHAASSYLRIVQSFFRIDNSQVTIQQVFFPQVN